MKYEVLQEVGHFVHMEAPEQVLRAVKELVSIPLHTTTLEAEVDVEEEPVEEVEVEVEEQ